MIDDLKKQAGQAAAESVQSGMLVGLGTGSTAIWAVRRIAARLQSGALKDVTGVPTSKQTESEARTLRIPLLLEDDLGKQRIDLTIDGADEIDTALNLIKGGGGALLREKIVATLSNQVIIVADSTKYVPQLGTTWAIPIEVVSFGWHATAERISRLGGIIAKRMTALNTPFLTDQGNLILDCRFPPLNDPRRLAERLKGITGVVEHGLFLGMTTTVILAGRDGLTTLTPPPKPNEVS